MKYLKQFLIILVFTLAGEALNYFVPLPVPAGVYGIVLLFLALETGAVKTEQVEDTGKFLIEIMPVTFISPAVGLIDAWADVKGNLLAYIAVTALTTVLVMSVSALLTQGVIRLRRKKLATEKTPANSSENTPAPREAIGNTLNGELAAENCEADGNARKAETARNGREDGEK
ncbi:MAG: CidA/LrgA family protein [Candidatus Scatosoma sp.]